MQIAWKSGMVNCLISRAPARHTRLPWKGSTENTHLSFEQINLCVERKHLNKSIPWGFLWYGNTFLLTSFIFFPFCYGSVSWFPGAAQRYLPSKLAKSKSRMYAYPISITHFLIREYGNKHLHRKTVTMIFPGIFCLGVPRRLFVQSIYQDALSNKQLVTTI